MTDLHFRLDAPQLLKEIAENGLTGNMGVLKIPLNIFRNYLGRLAEIAIELDDPKLNIIMLEMSIYEVDAKTVVGLIEEQKKRL